MSCNLTLSDFERKFDNFKVEREMHETEASSYVKLQAATAINYRWAQR